MEIKGGIQMKGVTTVLLAVLLAVGITFPGESVSAANLEEKGPFPDVPASHWASSYIGDVQEGGILQGFPDGSFRPAKEVTYGEFLKMAALAGGCAGFSEAVTEDGHWASPYFVQGLASGWYGEWEISSRALDLPIPREHMALVLYGVLADAGLKPGGGSLAGISDIHGGSPYAFEVSAVYGSGLLTGYPDGSFRPKGNLNRGEAAAVIWRLLERLSDRETSAVPVPEEPEENFSEEDPASGYFRMDYPEGDQYVVNDPADPPGTLRIVYDESGKDPAAQLVRIRKALEDALGTEGGRLAWETFLSWKGETLDMGRSHFKEVTLGGQEILLDTLGTKIYIFLSLPLEGEEVQS
ncbi:MAG: S-layer homology domain-containing protein [Clostridiales bacterium]|nr:S-layer homology domain-containing protein [Clostridiales bacterium]